jgi:lipoprotein-anchoring transpeptidase ErfK/SrfK
VRTLARLFARFLIVAIAVASAAAVAPAAGTPPAMVAPGVVVAGVDVGGLGFSTARRAVHDSLRRPLHFSYGTREWHVAVERFAPAVDVDDAVTAALRAGPQAHVELPVRLTPGRVAQYVAALAAELDEPAQNARLAGLDGALRPRIEPERAGQKLAGQQLVNAIRRALIENDRTPIKLNVRPVEPEVRVADIGQVVVVRRESKRLSLYQGATLVRTFPIATGKAEYPTPLGQFSIVDMQRNPWWRPPPSDWAKDAKPIPPGPDNPLGTRWMGFDRYMVGIHGTSDSDSIGTPASHGCIRMYTRDAEWLFDRIRWGTPVFVVGA